MIQKRTPLSSLLIATFPTLLLITSGSGQLLTRDHSKDCTNKREFFSSYDSINPGFKVLDALEAQMQFINHDDIGVSSCYID